MTGHDYPVFYANNVYWRYDRGYWYRSPTYRGGWAVAYNVPYNVRRIDRPYAYVHHRPYTHGVGYYHPYRGAWYYHHH